MPHECVLARLQRRVTENQIKIEDRSKQRLPLPSGLACK
jgi:hypothetical protein